ncbi:MAG TPA: hypothetical protein VGB77_00430 [Abditibacteriaceae bacterium]|jgi:hypothetical protein
MNTWLKIACVIAGRIMAGLCLGALWGTMLGIVCGALCGAIFAVLATLALDGAPYGLWFGAWIGACVGLLSGVVSFLLHSLTHLSRDANFAKHLHSVTVLMLKMNFIGALGGGLSGVLLGLILMFAFNIEGDTFHVPIIGPSPLYAAGFFYGSISGFFGSLLLAALWPEQMERGFAIWRKKRRQQKIDAAL